MWWDVRFFILKYTSVFSTMSIHYIHNFYNMLQFLTMCYKVLNLQARKQSFPCSPWLQGTRQERQLGPWPPRGGAAVSPSRILPSRVSPWPSRFPEKSEPPTHSLPETPADRAPCQIWKLFRSLFRHMTVLRMGPSFLSPMSQNFSAVSTSLLCLHQRVFSAQVHPVPANSWTGPG